MIKKVVAKKGVKERDRERRIEKEGIEKGIILIKKKIYHFLSLSIKWKNLFHKNP